MNSLGTRSKPPCVSVCLDVFGTPNELKRGFLGQPRSEKIHPFFSSLKMC